MYITLQYRTFCITRGAFMSNMCFRLQQGVKLISALGRIKIMNPFKGPVVPNVLVHKVLKCYNTLRKTVAGRVWPPGLEFDTFRLQVQV